MRAGVRQPRRPGPAGPELVRRPRRRYDAGGRHRHQRQDHHHLSPQGYSGAVPGGEGGADRHQSEHDRQRDPAHGAHNAGVL